MMVDSLSRAIVDYLKSRQSLGLLPQLIQKLNQAWLNGLDPNLATVTSAIALTPAQKSELKTLLSLLFKRRVRLKTQVEPQLLGGLKIAFGGRVIDTSLNSRLNQIGQAVSHD